MSGLQNRPTASLGNELSYDLAEKYLNPLLPKAFWATEKEQYAEGLPPDLCDRCRCVRWSAFAEASLPSGTVWQKVYKDDTGENLRSSSCSICQVFADRKPKAYRDMVYFRLSELFYDADSDEVADTSQQHLHLPSATSNEKCSLPRQAIGFLGSQSDGGVVGMNHADGHLDDFFPRIVSPIAIDFTILRGWLSHCKAEHGAVCQSARHRNLTGFKVIDCQSRCVVEAPDRCEYTALSYVWGRPSTSSGKILDNSMPATIQDSITVTLALGIKYIWIDRYVRAPSRFLL
jgi:hypothetical protein